MQDNGLDYFRTIVSEGSSSVDYPVYLKNQRFKTIKCCSPLVLWWRGLLGQRGKEILFLLSPANCFPNIRNKITIKTLS